MCVCVLQLQWKKKQSEKTKKIHQNRVFVFVVTCEESQVTLS